MPMLDRRSFGTAMLVSLAWPSLVGARTETPNPLLYRIERGKGVVYLFGFSEATDESWYTPKIRTAFEASSTLWLETVPGSASNAAAGDAGPPPDAALQKIFDERAWDKDHDLFKILPPDIAARTAAWADKLKIDKAGLAKMRPWFARITIQQAYAAQQQAKAKPKEKLVFPETLFVARARARGMPIKSEYPTLADLIRSFADLPEDAQSEYLLEQFDYMDDDVVGKMNEGKYGWISGHPASISLDRMREREPALYKAMHIDRNRAWAQRIQSMLDAGGTSFIAIGQNHVLGPDSIQVNVEKLGLRVERV